MAVYVDPIANNLWQMYGKMVRSCHLFADTERELHFFACRLGLKRIWAQGLDRHGFSHYDLVQGKRTRAIELGAIPLTKEEAVAKWQEFRKKLTRRMVSALQKKQAGAEAQIIEGV